IVWLSGDPHLSCAATLDMESGGYRTQLLQLCCSGLNAPLPFVNAQRGDYEWNTPFKFRLRAPKTEVLVRAEQHLLTDHMQHFVRLDIDGSNRSELRVQAFDAGGAATGAALVVRWDGKGWQFETSVDEIRNQG